MYGRSAIDMEDSHLEFKRQMVHLFNGTAIALAVYHLKPLYGLWILLPLFIAIFLLHAMPKIKPELKIMNHIMYHFERKKDIESFPFKGAIFYCYGIIFPIAFLPTDYAAASIVVLSVGDSFSNLVGRKYGRMKVGEKSIEGSLGFLIPSTVAASFFIDPLHAFVFSLVGAIIELFSFWDDNIIIPATLTLVGRLLLQ
jgi:dolichol kinase